ncbi:hypothetical protein [Fibrobacter sp.]|uniref:hypothetical protein n=1 Tax=Fibrobacter sp. TaxID=35828 RepID=UPI0038699098
MDSLITAYYISGIIVAFCAIIALSQIIIGKKQLVFNEENRKKEQQRDMVKCTAEQVAFLSKDVVSAHDKLYNVLKPEDISLLQEENLTISNNSISIKKGITLNDEERTKIVNARREAVDFYNNLEIFSSYFVMKIADENIAFHLIGEDFCRMLKPYLALYLIIEGKKNKDNAVFKLFLLWHSKLETLKLTKEKRKLEEALKKMTERTFSL